jgi:electron-transferring-flavoprotein dehydrogenase
MALAGMTGGRLSLRANVPTTQHQIREHSKHAAERLARREAGLLALEDGRPFHDALMSARGWPEIEFDGRLLVTHQDALLMGGKVQALPGFADHVVFRDAGLCIGCEDKTCIAMCSGQALTLGPEGAPLFEREKCIHCGACLWNCSHPAEGDLNNIDLRAGSGGLHSAEN